VLGVLALLPVLMQPTVGLALAAVMVAIWLAWKSVAYPLALAGIPTIVEAIVGYNPLPRGGVTFIFAAWIGIAVMFAVMRRTHEPAIRTLMSAPVLLSFVLLGVMILRLGPSPGGGYGSTKVQLYIADNLVFMVGAVFVGAGRNDLRLSLSILLIIAACGALLLMFKLLSGGLHSTFDSRFSLSANEYPIYLGRESANGVILAIYAVLATTRVWARMAAVAVLPLLLVALIASGSRGPVVAFAVGAIVFFGLTATNREARRRLLLVGAGLLGAAVVVPLALPGSSIGRAISTLLGSGAGLSSNGRSELWAKAFAGFAKHPLFGVGTGGFASLNPTLPYPHNLLLEMSVELGIVGILLIIGVIAGFATRLRVVWQTMNGRDKIDAATLIALFVMIFVNALFSGAIQDNAELWVWGGMGVGMSSRLAVRRRRDQRSHMLDPTSARAQAVGTHRPRSDPSPA
jgi:O-Antigen ligase